MRVYLCGGINGLSDSECQDWRSSAKQLLHGTCSDPMARDYRGREDEHVRDIVENDLDDIRLCDILLVNASRASWGTAMEIVYACQMQKTIIAFVGDARVSPWLRYHCDAIYPTLSAAVTDINQR